MAVIRFTPINVFHTSLKKKSNYSGFLSSYFLVLLRRQINK
jgi:hypothetical protein